MVVSGKFFSSVYLREPSTRDALTRCSLVTFLHSPVAYAHWFPINNIQPVSLQKKINEKNLL